MLSGVVDGKSVGSQTSVCCFWCLWTGQGVHGAGCVATGGVHAAVGSAWGMRLVVHVGCLKVHDSRWCMLAFVLLLAMESFVTC
jgi:hypothetical protein